MNIGDDGMMLAADGAAVGIRSCGYFHGPDGECTYEKFTPAEYQIRECGACGYQWNYGTPADRCPMEAEHEPEEDQDTSTLAWGPSAQREEPHPFTPAEGYSRWCAVCGYVRDAYAHASEEERRAFDEGRPSSIPVVAMADLAHALGPCEGCNAEAGEVCRPGCIGYAADQDEPSELETLRDAARRVVDAWESGDLAGAVSWLASLLPDQD